MTARTAALHSINELKPVFIDSDLGIFEVPSSSSEEIYYVQYDPYMVHSTCDCPAGTKGNYTCWHVDLVQDAFNKAIENRERDEDMTAWVMNTMTDEALRTAIRNAHGRIVSGDTDPKLLILVKMGRRIWRARRLANEQQP